MPSNVRFRPETILISSVGSPYTVANSPIILVPAAKVTGIQRVGVYKLIMTAAAAVSFQFQDTAGNALGAPIPVPFGATVLPFVLDMPINGDPWWQTGQAVSTGAQGVTPAGGFPGAQLPFGAGLQLALTGTGPLAADIWVALGA